MQNEEHETILRHHGAKPWSVDKRQSIVGTPVLADADFKSFDNMKTTYFPPRILSFPSLSLLHLSCVAFLKLSQRNGYCLWNYGVAHIEPPCLFIATAALSCRQNSLCTHLQSHCCLSLTKAMKASATSGNLSIITQRYLQAHHQPLLPPPP